jgi:hypothetical protein
MFELPEVIEVAIPLADTPADGETDIVIHRVHSGMASRMPENPAYGEEGFRVENNHVILYVKDFSEFSIGIRIPNFSVTVIALLDGAPYPEKILTLVPRGGGAPITGVDGTFIVPGGTYDIMDGDTVVGTVTISGENKVVTIYYFSEGANPGGETPNRPDDDDDDETQRRPDVDEPGAGTSGGSRRRLPVPPNAAGDLGYEEIAASLRIEQAFTDIDGTDMAEVRFLPMSRLNFEDHFNYIIGYPDGTVQPHGNITREETVTIFFRLMTDSYRRANLKHDNNFTDVEVGRWSNNAISTLDHAGMILGRSETIFDPSGNITRAEFAVIVTRFAGLSHSGESQFRDIGGHWAEGAINAAAENGWIVGENGLFRPDDYITRAEAMTLINRVLHRLPKSPADLHDDMIVWIDNKDPRAWYYLAVQEATQSHNYTRMTPGEDGIAYETWTEVVELIDWLQWEY